MRFPDRNDNEWGAEARVLELRQGIRAESHGVAIPRGVP